MAAMRTAFSNQAFNVPLRLSMVLPHVKRFVETGGDLPTPQFHHTLAGINAMTETQDKTAYYVRLMVFDKPGVLSAVTNVLKELSISVESLIQKGRANDEPVALVMVFHETTDEAVQKALTLLADEEAVHEVAVALPVLS